MMFDEASLERRVAELGKLLGPILVEGCGKGGDSHGEVYFLPLSGRVQRQVKVLTREHASTAYYRQLLLRMLDAEGDRIYEEGEIDEVLAGGIDPNDAAFVMAQIWSETVVEHEGKKPRSSAFCRKAARARLARFDHLYGPIRIPHIGDDGRDLEVYYRPRDGLADCACQQYLVDSPEDHECRILIERARTRDDKPVFKPEHLNSLLAGLRPAEIRRALFEMKHPSFLSKKVRLQMQIDQEAISEIDPDVAKN